VPIKSLSYAIFDGAVNAIGLALMYMTIRVMKSIYTVQNKWQIFARTEENNAVNCFQSVHNCVKLDFKVKICN